MQMKTKMRCHVSCTKQINKMYIYKSQYIYDKDAVSHYYYYWWKKELCDTIFLDDSLKIFVKSL